MLRILKNAGGSEQALRLASDFKCDICFHRQRPSPCLPASAHQIVDFNHRIGADVKFDRVALQAGFTGSKLDNCLYFCHGSDRQLQGVLGAHADDTITGGPGSKYESAVRFLRDRFPFRKWRTGQGQFLVTFYQQG